MGMRLQHAVYERNLLKKSYILHQHPASGLTFITFGLQRQTLDGPYTHLNFSVTHTEPAQNLQKKVFLLQRVYFHYRHEQRRERREQRQKNLERQRQRERNMNTQLNFVKVQGKKTNKHCKAVQCQELSLVKILLSELLLHVRISPKHKHQQ